MINKRLKGIESDLYIFPRTICRFKLYHLGTCTKENVSAAFLLGLYKAGLEREKKKSKYDKCANLTEFCAVRPQNLLDR